MRAAIKERRKLETSPIEKISTAWMAGAVIAVAGIGILYILSMPATPVDAPPERETEVVQEIPAAPPVDPEKQAAFMRFEGILNGFLQEVQANMRDYRQQRKMLTEMADPFNLRQPEYITENYGLLKTVAPELRTKMNSVVAPFEAAQAQIHAALADQPESVRENVWQRWEALKQKQLTLYVEYFTVEDQILTAYEELLGFYYQNQNAILVDSEYLSVSFAEPALEQQEQMLLSRIEELSAQQALILKPKPETAPEAPASTQTY